MAPLVLALWMAVVQPLSPCPEYLEALAEGADHEAAFDDAGAVAAYERALLLDAEAAEARHGLARALNAVGEAASGPEAEAFLGRALRLAESLASSFPDDPEAHYRVAAAAGCLFALRDGPEKVRLSREVDARARRALALDPCFAPAYVLLGTTYRELASLSWLARGVAGGLLGGLPKGTLEDAERLLAMAVDLDPDDPFARYQLALTLERRKRPREAIARLREVVELSPRAARDLRIQAEAVGRLARIAAASPR